MPVTEVWGSRLSAWPRGYGQSMGPAEDPSWLCPLTETSARGSSLGEQRGIFQSAAEHLGGCGWPRPRSGMGMELTREGMGRSPPPREGEEAETINTFAPVIQNLGVFTRGGSRGPAATAGSPGSSAPRAAGGPTWVPSGDGDPPMCGGHPLRLATGPAPRSSFPVDSFIPGGCRQGREGRGAGGGLKSGSPPCQTGPGLWQRLSSL